jgi:hypothetical protein
VIGATPSPKTIVIFNTGSLPLNWNMSADQPWISLSQVTGTLPNASSGVNKVAVLPTVQSVEAGTYNATLTVTGQDAAASPMVINVVVTLTDPSDQPIKGKDKDSDNDGTPDYLETCSMDPNKLEPGICGCGIADEDTNNDGVIDCLEKKKLMFPIKSKDGSILFIYF